MSLLLLLQLADSAFPSGGFVHSSGLEAACQLGACRGGAGLEAFLAHSLEQCGHASLPLVGAAHADPPGFAGLDRWADTTLSGAVGNRASRAQGAALLASAAAAFDREPLRELKREARRDRLPCHLATVSGAVSAHLGLGAEDTRRLFLFQHLRGIVSSAVRLGVVGPLEGQAIQQRAAATAEAVLARCAGLGLDDLVQTAPLIDCFQGHHDRLYSRLFSS